VGRRENRVGTRGEPQDNLLNGSNAPTVRPTHSPESRMASAKATRNTFHIGDKLVVIGAPARNESSTEIALVREVRRPRDGWQWRSGLSFASPAHHSGWNFFSLQEEGQREMKFRSTVEGVAATR